MNGGEAATEWLRNNWRYIPEHLRPPKESIVEFGAFLSTFLTSSFDVIEKPGTKGEGPTWGFCRCDVCLRIVNAPHLQAKKLYARDKKAAELLMEEYLTILAHENEIELDAALAKQLRTDEKTRRAAAYLTYGHWLIRRLSGESDGPAILALWRLIAWDPRGGMRPNFELKLDDFRAAERQLLDAMRRLVVDSNR